MLWRLLNALRGRRAMRKSLLPVVRSVESIDALDAAQRELLADAIREHRDLRGIELVVYRLSDGRELVAPPATDVRAGSQIEVRRWTEAYQDVEVVNGIDRVTELHVAAQVGLRMTLLRQFLWFTLSRMSEGQARTWSEK